jgi:hypothetical protein
MAAKKLPRRPIIFGVIGLCIIIILVLILGPNFIPTPYRGDGPEEEPGPPPLNVTWGNVVDLNMEGYEPSIATDSEGAMYITAHKNLDERNTWEYLASWFEMSTDNGATWYPPTEPFPRGAVWQTYLGDEGDIAVDAQDNIYYCDTYLLDNHIHVWADQGQYQYSVRVQKTTGLDDRPWITAQGNQIVHYLGNNGVEVNDGRYWYYRSTNGARTFTLGDPVPGNGWGHLDADRIGDHCYIISESQVRGEADIYVYYSDDQGATWDFNNPVTVGHRDGPGRQYPIISVSPDGSGYVWCLWNDATNGVDNGTRVFVGRSVDYGRTWDTWDITPFKAFLDYPTINAGPQGSVAVSFYASKDLPISAESEWYIYGALALNAAGGNLSLNFSIADPTPCYVGDNLHALHDFYEIVITPDMAINLAYQYYVGPGNGDSQIYFVRGVVEEPMAGEEVPEEDQGQEEPYRLSEGVDVIGKRK